jgi:5-methylcytosine-specific restriction enzyme A
MPRRRGRIPPGGYINAPNRMRGDPFYQTAVWRKFRDAVVAERGLRCEDKEHPPGKRVEQVDLDHIRELKDGGAPLDRSNVLMRCRGCHMRKTAQAAADRDERAYWARRVRMKEAARDEVPDDLPPT